MYLNKAILIGNLTRDPELKAIASGNKVCTFSLATNRVYRDASGNKQEKTEYHNIVVWGKTAENVAQYMKKGSQILVEGRIETRSWDDQGTGTKKYRTEIIADTIQFGSKGTGSSSAPSSTPKASSPKEDESQDFDTIEYPDEQINAEDIPF
ncbi:MAG: single-stranded DNA-binding protein [Candidatus Pacebacteria bacterium]|jgi:single-strand DNA-binding protein|nr:single-stranded DNA-binding protein [Candidatus Paceibacterota bacterium]